MYTLTIKHKQHLFEPVPENPNHTSYFERFLEERTPCGTRYVTTHSSTHPTLHSALERVYSLNLDFPPHAGEATATITEDTRKIARITFTDDDLAARFWRDDLDREAALNYMASLYSL